MRHHTTTALVLATLASLALTGCSDDSHAPSGASPAAASSPRGGSDAAEATPLPSAALNKRLLTENDLGESYVRKAERAQHNDDVTVIGCPALQKLGPDAAAGGSLDFPRKAKAAFTYGDGGTSEVSEELYSDTATKLSDGVGRIFDAMASCPKYQVVSGSTAISGVRAGSFRSVCRTEAAFQQATALSAPVTRSCGISAVTRRICEWSP